MSLKSRQGDMYPVFMVATTYDLVQFVLHSFDTLYSLVILLGSVDKNINVIIFNV